MDCSHLSPNNSYHGDGAVAVVTEFISLILASHSFAHLPLHPHPHCGILLIHNFHPSGNCVVSD